MAYVDGPMARHPTHQALILDFDGTIIDTEWPGYAAFQRLHDELGLPPIPLVRWQSTIGLADDAVPIDFFAELMSQLPDADPAEITKKRRRYRDEYVGAEQVRPGIIEWVNHARDLGLPVGVASSSSPGWVVGHLERLSLLHLFDHIEGTSAGQVGKPAPDVYLRCAAALGVDPRRAVAVEDSEHGVTAATAAGMSCVAVPNRLTAGSTFADATLLALSLADVDPAAWLCA